MTENTAVALEAINKWIYFCWNFKFIYHEWLDVSGEVQTMYVPEFLAKVQWTCGFSHILSKWRKVSGGATDKACMAFYAELSASNRRVWLEWVMENYNDECKLVK